jgi:hypothetical protein
MNRILLGCLALTLAITGMARAQMRGDKAIYFTFSEAVSVPSAELPAGKYLFRLADSQTTRSVVQIYSADGSKLHTMLITLPASRPQPSDDPELRFHETPANEPPAIANYWYPGERNGWEFIYPREQAKRLAAASKANVLTTARESTPSEMQSGDLVRVSPSGQETPLDNSAPTMSASGRTVRGERPSNDLPDSRPVASRESAPASSPAANSAVSQPSGDNAAASSPAPGMAARDNAAQSAQAPRSSQPTETPIRESLPATASYVPALALAGVTLWLIGMAVRVGRQRG